MYYHSLVGYAIDEKLPRSRDLHDVVVKVALQFSDFRNGSNGYQRVQHG